jgi:hypothetical protein
VTLPRSIRIVKKIRVGGRWRWSAIAGFHAFPETRFDSGAPVPAFGIVGGRQDSATGNQCGRASSICPRDCGIEAIRGSGPALPLPAVTLFQQHYRAGSPLHQKADRRESRFPISRRGIEDDRRLRSDASDPQGADSVAIQKRRGWTTPIYPHPLRSRRLIS